MANSRAQLTIFLIVFIDLLGFGLILPLLPYIAERFNANAFQIGLLAAVYSLFQFVATPIFGRLSDRYGRKWLLFVSQIGSGIGYVLLGWATSLPLLFLSRIIDGITGGNISIATAYMADITDEKNRAKGMGVLGAAFGLGFILGPVTGGLLSRFGFWVPALAAAIMSLVASVCTLVFLSETVNVKKATHSPRTAFSVSLLIKTLSKKPLGLLIIAFLLINLAFAGMQGTFALWTQDTYNWGPERVGLQFTFIGILSVIAQLKVLPWAIKRWGDHTVLVNAIPLLGLGIILIPLAINPLLMFIPNVLLVFGNSLSSPTLQAVASEQISKEEYGGVLGLLQSAGSLGRIIGPILGGQLYFTVSKDSPYILSGLIMFGTYLLLQHSMPPPRHWLSRFFHR